MDKYEYVKDIGSGTFGYARLMRNKSTNELVAMKFFDRGVKINENVEQEIINHRSLVHSNIIRFKEVLLTPANLVIVMEYAAGGELFDRIRSVEAVSEDEARYFFQQFISGISYCHFMHICHRDLKLANTLLDGSTVPNLKICDFGYSKSSMLHATPISTVGSPPYIAPEVLLGKEYDGQFADVWSCGVTLYVMLVGKYPFVDQEEPQNFRKTIQLILGAQYEIPDSVEISQDCRHLLSRIFVASPNMRITVQEIKKHPWFLKNLPWKESEPAQGIYYKKKNSAASLQSLESIMEIVRKAKQPAMNHPSLPSSTGGSEWLDDFDDLDDDEEQNSDDEEEQNVDDVEEKNVELEGKKEDEYDKQVTEVYDNNQVKEVDEDKQVTEGVIQKSGQMPVGLGLSTETHKRKRSEDKSEGTLGFKSPASMDIAARYANLLDQNRDYLTEIGNYEEMTESIDWWFQATVLLESDKPNKNRHIGFSRVPATQLLPDLAARYDSEFSGRGDSSSTATRDATSSTIPDLVFLQVVHQVLRHAQANLYTYHRPPLYEQVVMLARTALEIADPNSESTSTFSGDIVGQVIKLVGGLLTDIHEKYETLMQEIEDLSSVKKMDKYEVLKNIGAGSYGLTKLMRNKITKELVAVKFIQRDKINENVEREIINHRSLRHPNIVRFMEVLLTPTDIVIVMEYAAGGELFDRIITAKTLGEDEARYFFQQLILGVSYFHSKQICHRDLKLANTLLDGSSMPILKICDSGFSKSSVFHSAPNSAVGTLVYNPPELIHPHNEYDGKLADVWSCGVTLYFMLVGKYPFTDQEDPENWSQIMQRILSVQCKIPDSVDISQDCRHLLSRIFVAPASRRITIEEIKNHPWFLKNLPWKESEAAQGIYYRTENSAFSTQSVESIMEIVGAMNSLPVFSSIGGFIRTKGEKDNGKEQKLKQDYEDRQAEENLVPPEIYMSHARKRSRDTSEGRPGFMNPASMEIAVRYSNILDQNHNYFIRVGNYEDMTKLMDWWIHASVPEDYKPKKNRRIGLSQVPATQLLTDLAARYYSEHSASSSSTATGRADPSSIPDIVFVQVVRQVLQNAQANLPMYSTPPSYERVTSLARTALENADPNSQSTSTFSSDIIGEVIILVGNILADIFEKYQARTQKLQESALANEDFEDDTTDMEEDTDDTGNAARMSIRSINNGNGGEDR